MGASSRYRPGRPATEAVRTPPTLPRGGGHLRERSWDRPEARRGPLFCSLEPTVLFFQPRNRPSGMEDKRRQPREAPPAPVSQAGLRQGAPRNFASLQPLLRLNRHFQPLCAFPCWAPGARRGRSRDRASGAALSSERAGVRA